MKLWIDQQNDKLEEAESKDDERQARIIDLEKRVEDLIGNLDSQD